MTGAPKTGACSIQVTCAKERPDMKARMCAVVARTAKRFEKTMATETTVKVVCDRCGATHYDGPQHQRPEHVDVTFWKRPLEWSPRDLCAGCADDFHEMLRGFVDRPKHG